MKLTNNTTSDVEESDCGCQNVSGSETDLNDASSKRRRLLRAGLSAGPVILALSGKSAMASGGGMVGGCRFPSTWASVNPAAGGNAAGLSHHPATSDEGCGLGRSPGFWKQPQKRCFWPGALGGPKPDMLPCSLGTTPSGVSDCSAFLGDGTKVSAVFGVGGAKTFSQALCSENGSDIWHYMAAYLNAWTVLNYPLTPIQVVMMWNSSFKVGGVTWDRSRGRAFIESTYDKFGSIPSWKPGISCVSVACKPTVDDSSRKK